MDRHRLPCTQVIYYGIEDPLESADYRHSQFHKSQKALDVGNPLARRMNFAYVGRLVQEKGIPILLDAAQHLRKQGFDFEVLLVGDGPERSNLESQIRRNSLAEIAKTTGFLRGSALREVLDSVQVVVMPSVWEETAGLSAIEHMMRGRVVIAANIGGLGEVVGPGGLLFRPGDVSALAECMRYVMANPSVLDELGKKARQRALQIFTRDRMMAEHIRLYNSKLGRSA